MDISNSDNNYLYSIINNQGHKFQKLQNKIIKNMNTKIEKTNNLIESFDNLGDSDIISNSQNLINTVPAQITSLLSEIKTLDTQYDTFLQQYNSLQSQLYNSTTNYIQKLPSMNATNPYLNKNILVNSGTTNLGQIGYMNPNNTISTYPTSMINFANSYTGVTGQNLNPSGPSLSGYPIQKSLVDCQTACNNNSTCSGIVYSHPTKVKTGNDGSVSGDAFCKGVWNGGPFGTCSSVIDTQPANTEIGCSKIRGTVPSGSQVTVTCTNTKVKTGNDGSVSGDQYCLGSWAGGPFGKCISVLDTATNKIIPCSSIRGKTTPSSQVTVTCGIDKIKNGNNGTISGDQYCSSTSDGGPFGKCRSVIDTQPLNKEIGCSVVRGKTSPTSGVIQTCVKTDDNIGGMCNLTSGSYYTDKPSSSLITDSYIRDYVIKNDSSCSKDIMKINGKIWDSYGKDKNPMTPTTKCMLGALLESDKDQFRIIKTNLNEVATKIVQKIAKLKDLNDSVGNQVGLDKSLLDNYLQKYTEYINKYDSSNGENQIQMNNITGILNDTNIMKKHGDYNLILFSILGIIVLFITIKIINQ